MATKRRRARTSHVGVKLKNRLTRHGTRSWVARWTDPLTGAEAQQSLDALGLSTAEARRQWAIAKAEQIHRTAAAVAAGSAVAERVPLAAAIERFRSTSTAKASTLSGYEPSFARLRSWAEDHGIRLVQDLQPRHLTTFRDTCVKGKAAVPAVGATRGAKRSGGRRHAAATVNKTLTVCKLFLGWARRTGWTPHLDSDAIADRLKPMRAEREAVQILRPGQVVELLRSAQRHDAAKFDLTRAEHDGLQPRGTTLRYEPAAPFVLAALLLGMRLQELIGLRWDEVDLSAGEVRLPAARTKTSSARTVTLAESPAAWDLLRALRLRVPGDRVFPAWTADLAKATKRRLMSEFGAPVFSWQHPRRTCAAILTNAPAIFGAASAYRSAKRAGHSVAIAERHYVDVLRDLPGDARSIEAAVGVEAIAKRIVAAAGGGAPGECCGVAASGA
ncbi:MAG: tyrosine-type recombinase/integrase [Planctomycetes bacterium]|nr:tyrosine-type recombinase/integrase [Planctomycetota bacterium]